MYRCIPGVRQALTFQLWQFLLEATYFGLHLGFLRY